MGRRGMMVLLDFGPKFEGRRGPMIDGVAHAATTYRAVGIVGCGPKILTRTEQSLNNSLPNTTYQQVLIRATSTKNPRAPTTCVRC